MDFLLTSKTSTDFSLFFLFLLLFNTVNDYNSWYLQLNACFKAAHI